MFAIILLSFLWLLSVLNCKVGSPCRTKSFSLSWVFCSWANENWAVSSCFWVGVLELSARFGRCNWVWWVSVMCCLSMTMLWLGVPTLLNERLDCSYLYVFVVLCLPESILNETACLEWFWLTPFKSLLLSPIFNFLGSISYQNWVFLLLSVGYSGRYSWLFSWILGAEWEALVRPGLVLSLLFLLDESNRFFCLSSLFVVCWRLSRLITFDRLWLPSDFDLLVAELCLLLNACLAFSGVW